MPILNKLVHLGLELTAKVMQSFPKNISYLHSNLIFYRDGQLLRGSMKSQRTELLQFHCQQQLLLPLG